MKILFLSHYFYPDIGGIEINSEILGSAFTKAGHEVHLITWTAAVGDKKFPFTIVRKPSITSLLREHAWADVIFENNPCLRLAWPGLFFRRPSVIALNGWVSRKNGSMGMQDYLKLWWLKRAQGVIAVSDAIRKRCWPTATVIGNPFRDNKFKIIPEIDRNKDFVFLGRLVSDKGVKMAILALHQLITKHLQDAKLSLTIIGDGPERKALEKLVADLNLENQVCFTGTLCGQELVNSLNCHKYMLVPSVWEEPFGNVALEGMACGCLPIVSDGGGLPDAVGNAGIIFKRGDLDSMVEVIASIIKLPSLGDKISKASAEHLTAHTPEIVSRKYLDILELAAR